MNFSQKFGRKWKQTKNPISLRLQCNTAYLKKRLARGPKIYIKDGRCVEKGRGKRDNI